MLAGFLILFATALAGGENKNPATAEAYAELKRRLARSLADPQTYPEVKDLAVDLIYLAAKDWAAATNWQAGPSDA